MIDYDIYFCELQTDKEVDSLFNRYINSSYDKSRWFAYSSTDNSFPLKHHHIPPKFLHTSQIVWVHSVQHIPSSMWEAAWPNHQSISTILVTQNPNISMPIRLCMYVVFLWQIHSSMWEAAWSYHHSTFNNFDCQHLSHAFICSLSSYYIFSQRKSLMT